MAISMFAHIHGAVADRRETALHYMYPGYRDDAAPPSVMNGPIGKQSNAPA